LKYQYNIYQNSQYNSTKPAMGELLPFPGKKMIIIIIDLQTTEFELYTSYVFE